MSDRSTPASAAASSASSPPEPPLGSDQDLALGLETDHRFRCDACGNVTRFDVVTTATTRRFHHFDLGGDDQVEEEEILDRRIRSVTCRWCGGTDAIRVEPAPASSPEG